MKDYSSKMILRKRIAIISDRLEKVMKLAPARVDNKREKLLARFEDMKKRRRCF